MFLSWNFFSVALVSVGSLECLTLEQTWLPWMMALMGERRQQPALGPLPFPLLTFARTLNMYNFFRTLSFLRTLASSCHSLAAYKIPQY